MADVAQAAAEALDLADDLAPRLDARAIEAAVERHGGDAADSLEDVLAADARARATTVRLLKEGAGT